MPLSFALNNPVKEASAVKAAVKDELRPHRARHKIQLPVSLPPAILSRQRVSPSHTGSRHDSKSTLPERMRSVR